VEADVSTDYFAVCYTCRERLEGCVASGSIGYGFVVWDDGWEEFRRWLTGGPDVAVGAHENHDVRLVSEHIALPWEE
jgi:hypothetical protein